MNLNVTILLKPKDQKQQKRLFVILLCSSLYFTLAVAPMSHSQGWTIWGAVAQLGFQSNNWGTLTRLGLSQIFGVL